MTIQTMLKELNKHYTWEAIAEEIGKSLRQVHYYRDGSKPPYETGKAIEKLYEGIKK